MITDRFAVLLSPPNSPRMSDTAAKDDYYSQHVSRHTGELANISAEQGHAVAGVSAGDKTATHLYEQPRSIHQPYRNSPYAPLPPSQHVQYGQPQSSTSRWNDRFDSQASNVSDQHRSSLRDSVPTSPTNRLTPRSPDSHTNHEQDDDDLIESGGDDQEEEGERPPMTAAELRAAKRKMKRFRLTHTQTRFLMSEFTRQAHPDAAHRERLAREIPGLSARQVQVWFQNRRAKLKRLTSDDRERMMRSRALPADFDTTQALHFGVQPPTMGGSISNIGPYPPFGGNGIGQPLTVDTYRRVPEYEQYSQHYGSPSGATPALGGFTFTPPQSASEHLPPGSGPSAVSPFVLQQQAAYDRRLPVGMPASNQPMYAPQPQAPRIPLHDRLGRTASELSSSPLRTSVSYSGLGSAATQQSQHYERAASFSEHSTYSQQRPVVQRNVSSHSGPESAPFGLGFSYPQQSSYTQADEQREPATNVAATDSDQLRRSTLPATTYNQYQPSSFNVTPMTQYHGLPAQYQGQNFQGGYQSSQPTERPPQILPTSHHESQGIYSGGPAQHYAVYGSASMHQQVTDSQSPDNIPPY